MTTFVFLKKMPSIFGITAFLPSLALRAWTSKPLRGFPPVNEAFGTDKGEM
jgi:hypothetical protein